MTAIKIGNVPPQTVSFIEGSNAASQHNVDNVRYNHDWHYRQGVKALSKKFVLKSARRKIPFMKVTP